MVTSDSRTWYEELFHSGDYYRFWVASENKAAITEDRTRLEVDLVKTALPLATSTRILDLCCGHGRHSIPAGEGRLRSCRSRFFTPRFGYRTCPG